MIAAFAFFVCLHYNAPLYVFVIGLLLLCLENDS